MDFLSFYLSADYPIICAIISFVFGPWVIYGVRIFFSAFSARGRFADFIILVGGLIACIAFTLAAPTSIPVYFLYRWIYRTTKKRRTISKAVNNFTSADSCNQCRIQSSIPSWYLEICTDKIKSGEIADYLYDTACRKVINWEQFGCLYCEYVLFTKNKSA